MNVNFIKDYYPNLFSWKELSELINIRSMMTTGRVRICGLKEGVPLEKNTWDTGEYFSPSVIMNLLKDHVGYLRDMSRSTKKINDLSNLIETEYESPTDAHIYICRDPKIIHPFGIHYDTSHNVIVQCEGKTNFKVWNKMNDIEDDEYACGNLSITEDPILNVDMNPGDAVFIPAYYPHLATSFTSRMSVSFPFPPHKNVNIQNREWVEFD